MRLSDIMSAAGLSGYAVVALVIFFVLFIVIVVRLFLPSRRDELERAAFLPLDDRPQPPRRGGTT
jgi:cbb3-type cytochrome oxidase subunit 3